MARPPLSQREPSSPPRERIVTAPSALPSRAPVSSSSVVSSPRSGLSESVRAPSLSLSVPESSSEIRAHASDSSLQSSRPSTPIELLWAERSYPRQAPTDNIGNLARYVDESLLGMRRDNGRGARDIHDMLVADQGRLNRQFRKQIDYVNTALWTLKDVSRLRPPVAADTDHTATPARL